MRPISLLSLPLLSLLAACIAPPKDSLSGDTGDTGYCQYPPCTDTDTDTDTDSDADTDTDTDADSTPDSDSNTDSDTGTVVEPVWSYEGATGPEHWGELSEEWEQCATGSAQSPIDIDPELLTFTSDDPLELNWSLTATNAYNSGHYIRYNVDPGSTATNRDGTFDLVQFHFHGLSEHTVLGEHYAMEAHFVHVSQTDPSQLLVVAFLIDDETGNIPIDLLELDGELRFMDAVALPESETPTDLGGTVDMSGLAGLRYNGYAAYDGSLTTPPCSEGVRFYIIDSVLAPSLEAVEAFHAVYDFNYRPTQPLNGRTVEYTYGEAM